jgi:hypothetical protein
MASKIDLSIVYNLDQCAAFDGFVQIDLAVTQ